MSEAMTNRITPGQLVERLYNNGDLNAEDVLTALEASDYDWTKFIDEAGILRLVEDYLVSLEAVCDCLEPNQWRRYGEYISSSGDYVTVETISAFGLEAYRWRTSYQSSGAIASLEKCLENYGEPLSPRPAQPPLNVASDEWTPELHQLWHNPSVWQHVQTVTDDIRQITCLVERAQTADGQPIYRWVDTDNERYSPRTFRTLREAAIDLQLYLTENQVDRN